ncbi:hypothetical protein FF38_01485, partial [Lucilia cuprina]
QDDEARHWAVRFDEEVLKGEVGGQVVADPAHAAADGSGVHRLDGVVRLQGRGVEVLGDAAADEALVVPGALRCRADVIGSGQGVKGGLDVGQLGAHLRAFLDEAGARGADAGLVALSELEPAGDSSEVVLEGIMDAGIAQRCLADRARGVLVDRVGDQADGGQTGTVLVELVAVVGVDSGELLEAVDLVVELAHTVPQRGAPFEEAVGFGGTVDGVHPGWRFLGVQDLGEQPERLTGVGGDGVDREQSGVFRVGDEPGGAAYAELPGEAGFVELEA